MAVYEANIDRDDAGALIPEEVTASIFQGVQEGSKFLPLMTRLPNMGRKVQRIPVLSLLPLAYFVDGDAGLKQSTTAAWANKSLTAEEIAVIVPIPDSVIDDADYPIWEQVKPLLVEAIYAVIDGALSVGTNKPTSWPDCFTVACAAAAAASGTHELDLSADFAAFGDQALYHALLGDGGVWSKVEDDGYMVDGAVAHPALRAKLRAVVDDNGRPIFSPDLGMQSGAYNVDGTRIDFARNGSFTAAQALIFAGEFKRLVWAMRQDISYKMFDSGVITDGAGAVVYNLMQQDMQAMRVVIRMGWQHPNPVNLMQPTTASRYPLAYLKA